MAVIQAGPGERSDEVWRKIADAPYQVSSLGRVRGPRGIVLRPQPSTDGYLRVQLYHRGNRRNVAVHRLVLVAFDGPDRPDHDPHHKNGVRLDNRLDNLEWQPISINRASRGRPRGVASLAAENAALRQRVAELEAQLEASR